MLDLFQGTDKPYQAIYEALGEVREAFHREGRVADSNAKLDETVKFLAVHFANLNGLVDKTIYQKLCDRSTFRVKDFNSVFRSIATKPPFYRDQIGSIFGAQPATAFEQGDEAVAYELFNASGHAFRAQSLDTHSLDILNEAFGHHVRDNFRSHVEDAQYMTPPEVVDFMTALAGELVFSGDYKPNSKRFVMLDPSCGVGSFLMSWRKHYNSMAEKMKLPNLRTIGQDKVERMVRLSSANFIFSGSENDEVFLGNTVFEGSPLDNYADKVDLILTNPPFGARFSDAEIRTRARNTTPIFAESSVARKTIDSELLFIDRYLTLLKPGGFCLAVVPDGIVSAKGTASYLRQQMMRKADLLAVIEMPPVTFAQAGTRTKTAVLVFQKYTTEKVKHIDEVFFAEACDLGFQVSKRKGVPIKRHDGVNELPLILEAFRHREKGTQSSNQQGMFAVWREIDATSVEAWTPRFFKFDSNETLNSLEIKSDFLVPLKDLLQPPEKRKTKPYTSDVYYISVLHVIGEGILDIAGIKSYQPITPGIEVYPGEIIISRINPRIPRVCVVPDLGRPMLCSSEFEIFRAQEKVNPYAVAFLLLTGIVQEQIQALTAGTSASHSRIKPKRLYEIVVPWNSKSKKFNYLVSKYEGSTRTLLTALDEVHDIRLHETEAFK